MCEELLTFLNTFQSFPPEKVKSLRTSYIIDLSFTNCSVLYRCALQIVMPYYNWFNRGDQNLGTNTKSEMTNNTENTRFIQIFL